MGNPREGGRGPAAPGRSLPGCDERRKQQLEERRRANLQTKCFDPTTTRFRFLSFAERLQIQLKTQTSPLRSTGLLDLLEEQKALLERSVGDAGWGKRTRPDTLFAGDAEAEEERRKRRKTEELQFSSLREVIRHLSAVQHPPAVAALLSELAPLCDSLPLLLFHRERILQSLLRLLLEDEAIAVVLNLLQALAKDLRSEFVAFLPSVFSSLLLLSRQLELTVDAERLRLLFSCIGSIFRYLARPLLRDFDFALALFTPWLCGDDASPPSEGERSEAGKVWGGRPEKGDGPGRAPGAENRQGSPAAKAKREGHKKEKEETPDQVPSVSRTGQTVTEEIRLLAARAFACLLRKAGGEEGDSGDLLRCIEILFRHVSRCSPSAREAYGESVAVILFESVKSVQLCFKRPFDCVVRFLFATVLFQKPYVEAGERSWAPSLSAAFLSGDETDTQLEEQRDNREADVARRGVEEGGQMAEGRESGTEGKDIPKVEDVFAVYRAQVKCLVSFLLHARQHTKALESPGAKQIEALLLEFFSVAVKAAPSALLASLAKIGRSAADEETDVKHLGNSVNLFSGSFASVLASPFHAYFYNFPSPHPFTDHPYLSGVDCTSPLSSCVSLALAASGKTGGSLPSSPASPLFLAYGLLTLIELSGAWVFALPRLEGSFDAFLCRLFAVLSPALLKSGGDKQKQRTKQDSRKKKSRESSVWRVAATEEEAQDIERAPLVLQPLLATSVCLRQTQLAKEPQEGERSPRQGLCPTSLDASKCWLLSSAPQLEAVSLFSLFLPCAVLRLLSLLWRAVPLSFCSAVNAVWSSTSSDLFGGLLSVPLKLLQFSTARSLPPVSPALPATLLSSGFPVNSSPTGLLEAYVNCALAYTSMLHAHLAPFKEETLRRQNCVHSFGLYGLRPTCGFLLRLLASQPRQVALSSALPLQHPSHSSYVSGGVLEWERSAASLLLAQEVSEFVEASPSRLDASGVDSAQMQEKQSASNEGRLLLLQAKQSLPELLLAVTRRLQKTRSAFEGSRASAPPHSGQPTCFEMSLASAAQRRPVDDLACTYSLLSSFRALLSATEIQAHVAGEGEDSGAKSDQRREEIQKHLDLVHTETSHLIAVLLLWLAGKLLARPVDVHLAAQNADTVLSRGCAHPCARETAESDGALPTNFASVRSEGEVTHEAETDVAAVLHILRICFRCLDTATPLIRRSREAAKAADDLEDTQGRQQRTRAGGLSAPPIELLQVVQEVEEKVKHTAALKREPRPSFCVFSVAACSAFSSSEKWLAAILSLFSAGSFLYELHHGPSNSSAGPFVSLFSPLLRSAAFCISSVLGASFEEPDSDEEKTEVLESRSSSPQGSARLRDVVAPHLASILSCCSSSSRRARQDAIFFLHICSPFLCSLQSVFSSSFSASSPSTHAALEEAISAPSLLPLHGAFADACGAQLRSLLSLEKLPVGLETERKLINAYGALVRGATSVFSQGLLLVSQPLNSAEESMATPEEARKCLDVSFARTVAPILEATVRVLLSQLFVKFSPLWQPAIDAVLQLLEDIHAIQGEALQAQASALASAAFAAAVSSSSDSTVSLGEQRSSARSVAVPREPTEGERETYAGLEHEGCVARKTPSKAACASDGEAVSVASASLLRTEGAELSRMQARLSSALLSTTWEILTKQVARAVSDLGACRPSRRAAVPSRRKPEASMGRSDGDTVEPGARGRAAEANGDVESQRDSAEGVAEAGERQEGGEREANAFSKWFVRTEWKRALGDDADEVSDPLSRHTRLLRLVEGIMGSYGKDAFVSSRREEATEPGVQESEKTGTEHACREDGRSGTVEKTGGRESERGLFPDAESGDAKPASGPGSEPLAHANKLKKARKRVEGEGRMSGSRAGGLSRRREALARFNWLMRQTLCVVETLTEGGVDDAGGEEEGETREIREAPREAAEGSETPSVSSPPRGEGERLVTCEEAIFRTHAVSLVPRACDCLRAVVALSRVDPNCFLSAAEKRVLALKSDEKTQQSPEGALGLAAAGKAGDKTGEGRDETDRLIKEAAEAERLWTRLPAVCAQRLVTIADPSLQQLVIQVLQLSPVLRPQLAPYAPLLVQLISDKSSSNALLRLRLAEPEEEGEDDLATDDVQATTKHKSDQGKATAAKLVVVQEQHRHLVVPLVVRILMAKVQHRAAGRSATAVFAERRNVFAFLSSVAAQELPLLLSILLYPLVDVWLGPEASKAEEAFPAHDSSAALPSLSVVAASSTLLSGFLKEQYLCAFVAAQLNASTPASDSGFSPLERRRGELLARPASAPASPAVLGECTVDGSCAGETFEMSAHAEEKAKRVVVRLAPCCLPPNVSSRLPGCCKTLQQLQDMLKRLLFPATPFLILFYRALLQNIVSVSGASSSSRETQGPTREQNAGDLGPPGPSAPGRLVAGRDGRAYVKQTVHLCLLLLRQLLDLFPEASNIWRDLLNPAGPALQHLLEAAVATAAASPAGGRGPHEEGKKQKKNLPAIVSLVCSWAAQPAYFSFFSSVVPEALPTLFAVPALPAVLRRVAPSFGSEGLGRRAFGSGAFGRGRGGFGASCGVLDAVLDAALLLSVGGMDREREEALAASFHGEIKDLRRRRRKTRARGRHASQGSTKQTRRSAVSSSSSSSEEEKEMWVEEDEIAQRRQALLREQRELEAERQQHEREGMATLLPHVGGLLASLEILFQHRRLAALGGSQGGTAQAFGSSQGASGDRKLVAAREDADAGKAGDQAAQEEGADHDEGGEEEPQEREEDGASAGPQRSLFGVVRVKELQLLTRIARYAVADVNAPSEQLDETPLSPPSPSEGRPKVEAPASSVEASEAASPFTPVSCSIREERFSVVLRLIRLLVQSLPSGSMTSTLNPRLGSPSSTSRLLLSLEALLQLAFPLASQVRALREKESATPGAASAEFGAEAGPSAGVVDEDAGPPGEASKASPSSQLLELKGVLEAMTRHCSILLQSTVSSACRAAVAKLFLAVEFAACGVMLFSSDAELDEKVGAQIEGLLSRPQTGAQEEDEVGVEAKGQQLLAALVPGGSLLRALLTEREVQTDGGDARTEKKVLCSLLHRRCKIEETGNAHGETQPGSPTASPAGREATAREAAVAFVDNPETLFQWRLSVALLVFSLNYRRGQAGLSRGRGLALLADDEDQPDSSMQLIVLHALVASATIRGLPSPNASPASNEVGQVPPGLLEPLIRHCLFLLGAAGIEWPIQQAAAAMLKAVVDSVALLSDTPASRVTSSSSSSCMSRQSLQVRMQLLARLVMPFVRAQLKAPDDAQLRQGLHLLAYVVRTLAPVALRLPSLSASSGPEAETKRLRQLDKVFHLDLASLLAAPPPGAVAEALLESRIQKPGTEDAGGDFFRDFLHMQRHRQGRALQRLAQAARQKGIGATTLRLVALPLCFSSLLQRASLRPRSEEERKKKQTFLRKEVFHQGLAEQAVSCLEACSYRLKWPMTLNTVRLLSRFLSDFPEREGFLFRAICGVVRAFEAHVKQAVSEALHGDSRVDDGDGGARRERQTEGEESETEEVHEEAGQDEEGVEREEGEEHEEGAEGVSGSEDEDEGSRRREAAEGRLRARHRLELMHARIKVDLLPLLYRLAFGSSSGKKPSEGGDQMLTSQPGGSPTRGAQKDQEKNVRPSIVAVLLLLIRLLPSADFQQNLPKLVRSVAFNLRSRDRDIRRKARGALVSMAVSLGPSFFSVLVAEVGVLLRDRKPSGKKGGAQEEDVAGNSAQAFYRPVLLFTVHAMLKGLVDEEEKKRGDAQATGLEGIKTSHEDAGLDKALALVLPLIAEELSRVSDPDRPSQDPSTRQHSKIDEARHLKGPSMVFLLASCSSAASCASVLLPFLYSLLGGRRRVGDTVSSAYSPAYLEHVKDLFLHFVKGANKNRSLSPFFFFLLARRLLTLTVALLQSQLLHPLQLEQAGRRREHLEFLLAKQELRRQQVGGGRRRKARDNCLPLVQHDQLAEPVEDDAGACVEQAESPILQERMQTPKHEDPEPQRHRTREVLLREDAGFFHCMLFTSAVGLPGDGAEAHSRRPSGDGDKEAHSEGEDEEGQTEANFLHAPDSLDEAMALARERRLDGLRAAVAAKKDRAMVTQPGAAKGISLEKALQKKGLDAYTRQGFDSTSRATTVGFTGLRLLLSALKRWKFLLKKAKPEENSDAKPGSKVEVKTKATQRQLRGELEKSTFALLLCFCSNITDLISWTMRCLPHLLPLRLSALESRGAVVASTTLRLFHSMGGGWSSRREEDHQLFLACSRLLPLLLLHPQGNKWFAAALNPHVRVPQTHRQLLLIEMERTNSSRRAAKHAGKERGENQGEESAESDGSFEVGEDDEQVQTGDAAGAGAAGGSLRERFPAEAPEAVFRREKASEEEKREAGEEPLVLSDTQLRLLREEEEKNWRGKTDVKTRLEENFKEALLAQILHSLENPQLRLSGLMLFKTLVLPHYRDVAAAALASETGEGKTEGEGGKRKKDKAAGGKKARKNIGDSTLLCDVYRGVDTIVRLMIQEAGEDAEGRRLAAICGDIYSHFLLNFPMTEKTQQYRILFLIKNLHYSAPDGRRAVLNCLHKVLIRFPSELVVSRYSEVFLLALSGRLVLEEDRTAHEMLRMLLLLLLDIAQDSDDPEHSAASLFQTAVTVFLQPQIPKIMALQEFVLVFLDSQRERPMALLPRVLPLLHRMLLVAADREARERFRASGALPSSGDWRVSYKALLAFEKLMLFVHPSHLDALFSRAARAAASGGEKPFTVEGGEAGEESEAAGVNSVDMELETQVAAQILRSCMLPSTGAVGAGYQDTSMHSRRRQQEGLDEKFDSYAISKLPKKDLLVGAAVGRLWLEAVREGLRHEHPWLRAVSLRCAGAYIAAKSPRSYCPSTPCLFYLHKSRISNHFGLGVSDAAPASPGADVVLAALSPFCKDRFLEKNPAAVLSARALVLPLLQLALSRPDVVFVPPRQRLSRAQRGEEDNEDAGESEEVAEEPASDAGEAASDDNEEETREQEEEIGEEIEDDGETRDGKLGPTDEVGEALDEEALGKTRQALDDADDEDREEEGGEEPAKVGEGKRRSSNGSDREQSQDEAGDGQDNAEDLHTDDECSASGSDEELEEEGEDSDEDDSEEEAPSSEALALQVLLRPPCDLASSTENALASSSSSASGFREDSSLDLLAFENRAAELACSADTIAFSGKRDLQPPSLSTQQEDTSKRQRTGVSSPSSAAHSSRASETETSLSAFSEELVGGPEGDRETHEQIEVTNGGTRLFTVQDETSHPLLFLVKRLNFWLRRHLGTLGAYRRARFKKGSHGGREGEKGQNGEDICTSIVRVGAILSVFHALVYQLPLHPSRGLHFSPEFPLGASSKKRKRDRKDGRKGVETEADGGSIPVGSLSFSEAHLERLLFFVIDAAYRCSTVIRGGEEGGHKKEARTDSLLLQLLSAERSEGAFAADGGSSLAALWQGLASLSPKEQQREVLTGGSFLLSEIQEVLKDGGREELALGLLAKVRTSVLSSRLKRKVDSQQQALLQPQKYAEKRRRQQCKKKLSKKRKVALLIAKNRGGKRREKS